MTDQLSESIVITGRQAAQSIGVRLAGVDIVTPDVTADLACVGGVVLEVNTTPGLYIHAGRQDSPVAVPILKACLQPSLRNDQRQPRAASSAVVGERK